ncbi:DUF5694 domain-containing protein [Sphingomicrobium flavum]|uniref:DUF5694 domain-containing protein n=1 Tax=Sphingomicrobium flavum TaxID=1229164 RepID=UPI0021AD705E|nr:DUF5694 domain-containing protein [Sphingomicrobium flavum]
MSITVLSATLLAGAHPAEPPASFSLDQYDHHLAGEPTQALILGTAHLSAWSEQVDRAGLDQLLAPLLDRLEQFAPDVVAIEAVSGPDCDHLIRYGDVYSYGRNYCRVDEDAIAATGMDAVAAQTRVLEILLEEGGPRTAADRRQLAALFMAAGDHYSAVVQWQRLDPAERVAGGFLTQDMAERLDRRSLSMNENISLGVALAVRLGHERVYPVDDHSADHIQLANAEHYGAHMREIWAMNINNADEKRKAAEDALRASGDVMAYYRWMNSPEAWDLTMTNDFALALADDRPEGVGRTYAAWWQARNLRMTANIVTAVAMEKADRVLAIVGASHAPYYRDYLDMMHDIEIVDAQDFLAASSTGR